jgi:hypothetical protein
MLRLFLASSRHVASECNNQQMPSTINHDSQPAQAFVTNYVIGDRLVPANSPEHQTLPWLVITLQS